jgi:hypothetical protein
MNKNPHNIAAPKCSGSSDESSKPSGIATSNADANKIPAARPVIQFRRFCCSEIFFHSGKDPATNAVTREMIAIMNPVAIVDI